MIASALLRQNSTTTSSLAVRGYATAHVSAQVAAVEVSVDDGENWQTARITYQEGKWSWTLWEVIIEDVAEHGQVFSRAIDAKGHKQYKDCKWNMRGVAYNPWGTKKW